jgi:HEPN domain-containing protein
VTRKDEEKNLLERSTDFLETAEYQEGRGFYNLATFSLEQGLQLFLKAKVLAAGGGYPRIYSVTGLLDLISDLVPDNRKPTIKGILKTYFMELGMLEDAYITSRYGMRAFTKREAEKLMEVVKEIMKNVT